MVLNPLLEILNFGNLYQKVMANLDEENFGPMLDKIIAGMGKAIREMVEESALRDETVVIGGKDGQARHVSARELLKSYDQPEQNTK